MAIQNNDQYVGQLLVRDRIITTEELERGLSEQKKRKDYLCSTLVRLGYASEERIFSILSLQIGVPFLNLKDFWIDPLVLTMVPGGIALAFKCMPLKIVDDVFYVAMTDPLNLKAIKEFKSYFGLSKVKVFLAGDSDIRESIKKYYAI